MQNSNYFTTTERGSCTKAALNVLRHGEWYKVSFGTLMALAGAY